MRSSVSTASFLAAAAETAALAEPTPPLAFASALAVTLDEPSWLCRDVVFFLAVSGAFNCDSRSWITFLSSSRTVTVSILLNGGRFGVVPKRRFQKLVFVAGLVAAVASHSSNSRRLFIRTLINTSGYVCPLNVSMSTKAIGLLSTVRSAAAFLSRLDLPDPRRPNTMLCC